MFTGMKSKSFFKKNKLSAAVKERTSTIHQMIKGFLPGAGCRINPFFPTGRHSNGAPSETCKSHWDKVVKSKGRGRRLRRGHGTVGGRCVCGGLMPAEVPSLRDQR